VKACFLMYNRGTNGLYLMNDAGTAWLSPVNPGTLASVSNSQCTLLASGSSISGSGNTVTLRFNLAYQTGFAGVKSLYLAVFDLSSAGTGWQSMGTTTIGTNASPLAVSVVPTTPGGNSGTLTTIAQDANGYADIQIVYLLIDRTLSGLNACFLMYNRGTNGLYLMNDAGTSWLPALVPGASGAVSNSQCTLNANSSSVNGAGATLSVVFSLQFQPGFAGSKNLYFAAFDFNNAGTGWQAFGSWAVP